MHDRRPDRDEMDQPREAVFGVAELSLAGAAERASIYSIQTNGRTRTPSNPVVRQEIPDGRSDVLEHGASRPTGHLRGLRKGDTGLAHVTVHFSAEAFRTRLRDAGTKWTWTVEPAEAGPVLISQSWEMFAPNACPAATHCPTSIAVSRAHHG